MRSLTFPEFFALPPGILFRMDPGRQRPGDIWIKGNSVAAAGDRPLHVEADNLIPSDYSRISIWDFTVLDGDRFLIVEKSELNKLAGLIFKLLRDESPEISG